VANFYYYIFSSRQCDNLKEAYNRYEDDWRQDKIISTLSQAVQRLDRLEKSQSVIYHAINKSNATSQVIAREISYLGNSVKNMNYSFADMSKKQLETSELNAYYAKESAINTELIAKNQREIRNIFT
jgi:arsenate reductase-like glutaredoxin family protein